MCWEPFVGACHGAGPTFPSVLQFETNSHTLLFYGSGLAGEVTAGSGQKSTITFMVEEKEGQVGQQMRTALMWVKLYALGQVQHIDMRVCTWPGR